MERKSKYSYCVLIGFRDDNDYLSICNSLDHDTKYMTIYEDIIRWIQANPTSCLIFKITENNLVFTKIQKLKKNFSMIPIIGVFKENLNLETARYCGQIGVDKVLVSPNQHQLSESIKSLVKSNIKVHLADFGINLDRYSGMIKHALEIIQEDYLSMMSVSEFANRLNVHESRLSREFRKHEIVSPKKLLLHFKIEHSILLMQNLGLNIKEIAFMSGFSNEHRFNECFHRVHECSPGSFREKHLNNYLQLV